MSDALRDRIHGFLASRFPAIGDRKLTDIDPLLEDGLIDSLGILDLVGFLETEFGIKIEDEELNPENFDNITAMVQFVERKR